MFQINSSKLSVGKESPSSSKDAAAYVNEHRTFFSSAHRCLQTFIYYPRVFALNFSGVGFLTQLTIIVCGVGDSIQFYTLPIYEKYKHSLNVFLHML